MHSSTTRTSVSTSNASGDEKGYSASNRMRLPSGQPRAADRSSPCPRPRKGVNMETFAPIMARIRPRTARCGSSRSPPTGRDRQPARRVYDSYDMLIAARGTADRVRLTKRWLDPQDSLLKLPSDYMRHVQDGPSYAVLPSVLDGVEDLFAKRNELRVEVRHAHLPRGLRVLAQHTRTSPGPDRHRPTYVPAIDRHTYSSARGPTGLRPIKDGIPARSPAWTPSAVVKAYPVKPFANFVIPSATDTFALYSVGPDDSDSYSPTHPGRRRSEGDYILWPPMISSSASR